MMGLDILFEIGSKVKVNIEGEKHSVFAEGEIVTITEIGTLLHQRAYHVTDGQRQQVLFEDQMECI